MWRCKFEAEVSKCERPSKETCLEYPWKWICWASLGLLSSGIAGVHVLIWHFSNEHGSTIVLFVSCTTSWRVWNDVRELYSLRTLQDQCFQKHVQKFALVTRKKKSKHRQEKDRVFSLDSLSARKHHKALICFLSSLSANLYVPYLVLHVAYPCAGQWTSVAAGASFPQTSQVTV